MADGPEIPDLEVDIPVPGGLHVTADKPYHILVISDFAGSEAGTISGELQSSIVAVSAENFDSVMAAASPHVSYTTSDPLASGDAMVEVDLRFDSLRAFDPGNLIGQIPAARALKSVRDGIVERMDGKTSAAQLNAQLTEAVSSDPGLAWLAEAAKWSPAKPVADPGVVDSLLGQIDLDDSDDVDTSPPVRSPIGDAVAAAARDGSTLPSEEVAALRRALREIDRRLSLWLTAVLHDPKVQGVESAWRSLAFLVKNVDFRKGLRLSLLHAPGGSIVDRLVSHVIDPVFDEGAEAPNLIVVDASFSNSTADLESLDELAQHAASLPAVVLAGVSPGFFGVKHAWQMGTLPTIPNLFDQYQFAKWRSLRANPYARSLGVVFGRGLLRACWAKAGGDDRQFAYEERCISDRDFVWACGAIPAAVTVARSAATLGWPTMMSGYLHGRIEGFATAHGGKNGDKKFGPTDTILPETKIEELGSIGVNAAVGLQG
ncbi:MAG: type VI secretion system contractile sheath domain-containing protein, partial [Phycisphaerae bacterium]